MGDRDLGSYHLELYLLQVIPVASDDIADYNHCCFYLNILGVTHTVVRCLVTIAITIAKSGHLHL